MAYSTQKDFFHVPFMNEDVEYECKRACVKLKSYDSTIDDRSWSHDENQQSKFLTELVTCQFAGGKIGYFDDNDDDDAGVVGRVGGISRAGNIGRVGGIGVASDVDGFGGVRGPSSVGRAGGVSRAGHIPSAVGNTRTGLASAADGAGNRGGFGTAASGIDIFSSPLGVVTGGDSLLECANIHLADYQNIMNVKTTLEKQLEVSNDRLKTANEENQKIKEILASKLDSNTTKDFYNKIQKLIAAGKLSKNEENEMLQIYQKMENLYKAYEIIQAENYYLKRLIEKMSSRVSMDTIKSESEQSTDIGFLQKEVNKLRKECIMLRAMEDEYLKIKQQSKKSSITEQDADNIRAIIKERNSLRDKCQSLKHLERKVQDLEHKAKQAKKVAGQLSNNLNNQTNYINKVESDLQSMQKYYENANQNSSFTQECLKAQIEDLKDELMNAKCQAQKAEILQMEVGCLRNELLKRDLALNDYDCQYKQLMEVVNELRANKLQYLPADGQPQTSNNTDEVALYTAATLEEITKELKKREASDADNQHKDCCKEIYRLQKIVDDTKKENNKLLQNLEDSTNEKALLNKKFKESEEKIANMLTKVDQLEGDINKNGQDTSKIGKDLQGTLGLVNEISSIQLKNQQLANAVSAINSRDDEKIIDDLRRQLEEELAKLKKCQQDNDDLIKQSKERENDLKILQDLNKKLEADKKQLQEEKRKGNLQDDDKDKSAALDEFVNKKSGLFQSNIHKGRGFEKELRQLLEDFIDECRYCFCRLGNPKSKFYGICHRLYHCGMNSLSFQELGYLHKKIFALAEQRMPGCLLNMILEEYKEYARSLLARETKADLKLSETNIIEKEQKCCCCKNELCCNNSEEMLKDKVHKLEKDIKIARRYLYALTKIPVKPSRQPESDDFSDNHNESSTFRQKATTSQRKKKYIQM